MLDPTQAAERWQEDQILRTTRSLGYDPMALPPDDKSRRFVVKSLIRIRCGKNHPVKMRASQFDKAWARMFSTTPPTLEFARRDATGVG